MLHILVSTALIAPCLPCLRKNWVGRSAHFRDVWAWSAERVEGSRCREKSPKYQKREPKTPRSSTKKIHRCMLLFCVECVRNADRFGRQLAFPVEDLGRAMVQVSMCRHFGILGFWGGGVVWSVLISASPPRHRPGMVFDLVSNRVGVGG